MPMNITIEVHTDPDGEASGNKANTDARKRAIEEKLRSLGVNPAQISVTSHGETKPLSVPSSKASDYRRLAIRLKSSGS
jgi:outer membrane protein OmpA-like peptidoglycan-associated protein